MKKVKIIHTADWHIGYRQYSNPVREEDIFTSAMNIVELAKDMGVDAIVNSGDILHTTRPSAHTIHQLAQIDAMLKHYNIPMFTISGNHDRTEPHWIDVINPLDHFSDRGIVLLDNARRTINDIVVAGFPEMSKARFEEKVKDLEPCDIFLFHGSIVEFIKFPNPNAFSFDDLPTDKCQYIATGDTHITSVASHHDCKIASPGSIELLSSSEDENKFVILLTFVDGKLESEELIPLKTRKVLRYSFPLASDPSLDGALEELDNVCITDIPLVYVSYDSGNKEVVEKFGVRLRANKILELRRNPIVTNSQGIKNDSQKLDDSDISLHDALKIVIPEGSPTYSIASKLIDADRSSYDDMLENHINTRMKELTESAASS